MKNPNFLKRKYDLHNSDEVEKAAQFAEKQTGTGISRQPLERIQNYLNRFNEILERTDKHKKQRGIKALKRILRNKFVIKPDDVPESAFLLEQRIAHQLGYGTIEITDEFKQKKIEQIITNQANSLYVWIEYLTSADALYPDYAKYWAFRSVLEMGKLQKTTDDKRGEIFHFQKRRHDTVAPFPPLNQRALALTMQVLQESLEDRGSVFNLSKQLSEKEFEELVATESFSKIYAQFLLEIPEYSTEGLQEIRGTWTTYDKGSDASQLVASLEGYPLEWCTAGLSTAELQLREGDFHVYYSINESGESVVPRLAIRMEANGIAEVRGIAPHQHIDPYIAPVLDEKLKEFGESGDEYKKKSADMQRVTTIETSLGVLKTLSADDLTFLYEIDRKIQGFGYSRDPRIDRIVLEVFKRKIDSKEVWTRNDLRKFYGVDIFSDGSSDLEDYDYDYYLRFDFYEALKKLREHRDVDADARILFPRTAEIEDKIERDEVLTKDELEYVYEIHEDVPYFRGKVNVNFLKLLAKRDSASDARILFPTTTKIEDKIKRNEELTKEELEYLYEVNGRAGHYRHNPFISSSERLMLAYAKGRKKGIHHTRRRRADDEDVDELTEDDLNSSDDELLDFEINDERGYCPDPRIELLLGKRKYRKDMAIICNCTEKEIARTPQQIQATTKAYVGKLTPGIFKRLPNGCAFICYGRQRIYQETIGMEDVSREQLGKQLVDFGICDQSIVRMLCKDDTVSNRKNYRGESIQLIRLTLADLGFEKMTTVKEIFSRVRELGLSLCPNSVLMQYCIRHRNDSMNDKIHIATSSRYIANQFSGMVAVFMGKKNEGVASLSLSDAAYDDVTYDGFWSNSTLSFSPDDKFIFCV